MEVDAVSQSSLIGTRPEAMDTTDGVATSPPTAVDNNNHKHTNIYLENNLPVTSHIKGDKSNSPLLSLNTDSVKPRNKSLAETIETLKQNHPLTVNSAVSNLADGGGDSLFSSRLHFTQHDSAKAASTSAASEENAENQPGDNNDPTQMSCDIICNCDGTVYLTPSDLSSKLLTPDGVLNEPSDAHCLPFPVSAKQIYYHSVRDNSQVHLFSVVTESAELATAASSSDNSIRLAACLPCRLRFRDTEKLLAHGCAAHSITKPSCASSNSLSAVIQEKVGQSPELSFLTFAMKLTVDNLLVRAAELQPVVSASLMSQQQPAASGSQPTLFSPGQQQQRGITPVTGCEDHPEGGIECPKCDLILSSARSLGGKYTANLWHFY